MTHSSYLLPEAEAARLAALVSRIAAELSEGPTWAPDSDYWLLPPRIRALVQRESRP